MSGKILLFLSVLAVGTAGAVLPPTRSTYYDGTAAAYAQFNHRPEFDATIPMTVEAWVYRINSNRCETIISHDYTVSFWFGFCPQLRFYRSGVIFADAGVTVPEYRWTHVAASYDGTNVQFYLDGQLVAAKPLANAGTNFNRALRLGSDVNCCTWQGHLDEVRLWSVARTPVEISAGMFQQLRSGPGLVAAFPGGGAFEALSGTNGVAGTGISSQIVGILPRELTVPKAASAVQVDGQINTATEYAGAEQIVIRYLEGGGVRDGVAYLVHRDMPGDQNLYIGVPGVWDTKGTWPRSNSWVAVQFDPDYSRDTYAQTNDFQVRAALDASAATWWWGDGAGGFTQAALPAPSNQWQVAYSSCQGTTNPPCLEFRLHRLLFNSCERPAGFVLGHYQVGGQSDDYLAPSDAAGDSPLTWTLFESRRPEP